MTKKDFRFHHLVLQMNLHEHSNPDYVSGFKVGLDRLYFGKTHVPNSEHDRWMNVGLEGVDLDFDARRKELGRGYRDGFAGKDVRVDPPSRGRPSVPDDERRDARIEWRTTQQRKDKLLRLAEASGLTVTAWLDQRIDRSRETNN